jgi:hypothetical protein
VSEGAVHGELDSVNVAAGLSGLVLALVAAMWRGMLARFDKLDERVRGMQSEVHSLRVETRDLLDSRERILRAEMHALFAQHLAASQQRAAAADAAGRAAGGGAGPAEPGAGG